MNEAQAHEAILQHWKTAWEALRPTVLWTPTSEILDSQPEWLRVSIAPALSRQSALGALKRWTRSGTIGVQIFTLPNAGTLRMSQLADDVRTVLEGQFITSGSDPEPVVTLGGSTGSPVSDGAWLMCLVSFAYEWSQLR